MGVPPCHPADDRSASCHKPASACQNIQRREVAVRALATRQPLDPVSLFGHIRGRKRGRVVEGSGFENRRRATYQGFESLRFRKKAQAERSGLSCGCEGTWPAKGFDSNWTQSTLVVVGKTRNAPQRHPWAWLLKRVFLVDITERPGCGGRMKRLEVCAEKRDIHRAVSAHGLSPRAPSQVEWMHPGSPAFPSEERRVGQGTRSTSSTNARECVFRIAKVGSYQSSARKNFEGISGVGSAR